MNIKYTRDGRKVHVDSKLNEEESIIQEVLVKRDKGLNVKSSLCGNCGQQPANPPQTCPYQSEIEENYEECNCCDACRQQCEEDI